ENCALDFRDRNQAGVGLVQAHPTGIEQQQYCSRTSFHCTFQQAGDFGTVYLSDGAAHKRGFLRSNQNQGTTKATFTDHYAIVEGNRLSEYRQMRTEMAFARRQYFDKTATIK